MEDATGPSTPPNAHGGANQALADDLIELRNSLTTPESVGRALVSAVLTQAVTNGTQTDANTYELPMTVTTKVDRSATDKSTTVCTTSTLIVLGVEVISWKTCTTTTPSS